MGKKREKAQAINQIQNLNLEIDYDKLAEAIVKAQEKSKKTQKRPNRFRGSLMAVANTIAPFVLTFLSVYTCVEMWQQLADTPIVDISTCIKLTVLFSVIAFISICCGVEALKDDDENAIMHFNSNVALVALIISLIALLKEVL